MDNGAKFDVFISYRRDGGEVLSRLVYELLKDDYKVFFDHETLSSGRFDTKLLDIISNCTDVLVVLPKNSLDRCKNDGDWFMREINSAIEHDKNIILLMTEDFVIPSDAELESYPKNIATLLKYNGHRVSIAYVDSIISKLYIEMHSPRRERPELFDELSDWRALCDVLGEPVRLRFLPEDIKIEILKRSAKAFLEGNNGKMLEEAIENTYSKKYNYRTKFRYEIDIDSEFSFSAVDIPSDRYFQLSETLAFRKKFVTDTFSGEFWLSFVTSLDALDNNLKNANFFFSENLLIAQDDVRLLSALDDEEKRDFYLDDMRVKININGSVLKPVEVIINEGGVFAKYEMDGKIGDEVDVKIRFKIPQEKENGYFFASISDPTYSPYIRFSYPEDEINVKMIPFLSRKITAKDTKIFEGVRELSVENEWIMPVSGAVFVIEVQQ